MLSSNLGPTDNVLWDPLTGCGVHLGTQEYLQFRKKHENDWNSPLHPFPIYGNRHLGAKTSPGEISMCYSMFGHCFILSDPSDHHVIRTIYIARHIDQPELIRHPVCFDGPSAETRSITLGFEEAGCQNSVPLPDGSLILLGLFENGLVIVRLEKDGRQDSSVGGSILALDAAKINNELRATPSSDSDPSIR